MKRNFPIISKSSAATCTALLVSFFRRTNAWMSPTQMMTSYFPANQYRSHDFYSNRRHSTSSIALSGWSSNRHIDSLSKSTIQLGNDSSTRQYLSSTSTSNEEAFQFQTGDKIQVEVISFGPMGASVSVVGKGHEGELLPVEAEPYGEGLILQKEIAYFRQARDYVDVVRGEILPAYVQKIRDDGKIDIGLRAFGGKAKADEVSNQILELLEASDEGYIPVGDKSTPAEISKEFPGVSKAVFKKAVGALFKKGLVSPSPNFIALAEKQKKE